MTPRTDIAVVIDAATWAEALPDLENDAGRAAAAAVDAALSDGNGRHCASIYAAQDAGLSLSVVFAEDAAVRRLNRDYRGLDKPTNVLSFATLDDMPNRPGQIPMGDEPIEIGDVIVAFETARREANEASLPLIDHTRHLVVHGVLHLFGYDHEEEADAEVMETLEIRILSSLGVPNPYLEERV